MTSFRNPCGVGVAGACACCCEYWGWVTVGLVALCLLMAVLLVVLGVRVLSH